MSFFFRVFSYLARYPWLAFGTIVTAITSTLMIAIFPAVTEQVIDQVLKQGHSERLVFLLLVGLTSFFLQNFLNGVRILFNNHFEQRVIVDLRSDLYRHIQLLPLSWFDQHTTGDIMTRLMEDVTSLERALIDGIEQGSVALLQIVIVLGLMFYYSPSLTLAALLPFPFLLAGTLIYTYTAHERFEKERFSASLMNSILHDNIDGIRQIKTYTNEEHEQQRFDTASHQVCSSMLRIMKAWALYNPTMAFLSSLGMLLILAYGTNQVLQQRMGLGVLVAFLVLVRYLYEPVDRLNLLNHLFQAGRAASRRLFSILDEKPEPGYLSKTQAPLGPLKGAVTFHDVSFSYEAKTPILQHISLEAKPGEMIALVGPTGSGKTSLVSLLSRFYEISEGDILLDGHPIKNYPSIFCAAQLAW